MKNCIDRIFWLGSTCWFFFTQWLQLDVHVNAVGLVSK